MTSLQNTQTRLRTHFYPRPPRGGRPFALRCAFLAPYFYPRPPRGGRRSDLDNWDGLLQFLSTSSARRTTAQMGFRPRRRRYFYPRPPQGGRPLLCVDAGNDGAFLSTSSARRTTPLEFITRVTFWISIHVLRKEDDYFFRLSDAEHCISIHVLRKEDDLRSRPFSSSAFRISIHVLRKEDDNDPLNRCTINTNFYPRPP